ncbi:MAG TPA: alpha/beta hydrolase [Candidatus Obscuribacterales bacterium]
MFTPTPPQPDKPLLVLLPGLDGTGKLFAPQIPSLAQHFDVRCLNIPQSNRQPWAELARSVIDLIYHTQGQRPTYLCGESFGGCLALQIALTAPELLSHLILINPASALRRQGWLRWTTQATGYVPEWLFNLSGAFALSLLANFDRIEQAHQDLFVKTVRPVPQSCVSWRLAMLQTFEAVPAQLQRLTLPTALVASGCDRLFPSDQEALILQRDLPQATIYSLPYSGHVCLLEKGVNLAQCLQSMNFLAVKSLV